MRIITATGIPGYGPDASDDNYSVSDSWPDVADEVRRRLDEAADGLLSVAHVLAEAREFEDAWKTRQRADAMWLLHDQLSNTRADAPLYRGNPQLWAEAIERIIGENFPYDVDPGCRIYVWADELFGMGECPCCRRMAELGDDAAGLCDDCHIAGDADQECATPAQPYPYCAATDSSPLA